jgi:hypothetical protein
LNGLNVDIKMLGDVDEPDAQTNLTNFCEVTCPRNAVRRRWDLPMSGIDRNVSYSPLKGGWLMAAAAMMIV